MVKKTQNKCWVLLGIIIFIGVVFRLWGLYKPEGLWFDEYLTYDIAIKPFPWEFFDGIINQNVHMPLHYLYLLGWIKFFGSSDLALRMSSLFCGILSIPVIFLAGKELDSNKTGLFAAFFLSINSFAIYYSQEMRIYSLILLFASLSLLFLLRVKNNPTKLNLAAFALSNLGILYTHTIGFVFVFFEVVFFLYYLYLQQKETIKPYIITNILTLVAYLPGVWLALHFMSGKSTLFVQWWDGFSFSKPLYILSDFFSPGVINIVTSPDNYFSLMYSNNQIHWAFIIIALVPTLIGSFGIIKSTIKNPLNQILVGICLGTVSIMVIAALLGKMIFLTKYAIELLPIILLLGVFGVSKIKHKALAIFLAVIFAGINLIYLIESPYSVPKKHRSEGHKVVGDFLHKQKLDKNDFVISLYYPNRIFNKYYKKENTNTYFIDKFSFYNEILDYAPTNEEIKHNGHEIFRGYLQKNNIKFLENNFQNKVFSKLKPHQRVVLINFKEVTLFTPEELQKISSQEKYYKQVAVLFLLFTKIKYDSLGLLSRELRLKNYIEKDGWEFYVFEKES